MESVFPLRASEYQLQEQIGKGHYSRVFKALCRSNNQVLAIKEIDLEEYPQSFETIQKQVSFWSKCSHPNVVSYYGSFMNGSKVWILTEFMAGGSIDDILKFGFARGFKDESLIATIIHGVVSGLAYLHASRQIHRDVRASNILIGGNGEVKLADFGLATSLIQDGKRRSGAISMYGDASYMAPEILKSINGYNELSDIWSLGLTAIEMATGKMPYAGLTFMESLVQIIDHDPPSLPNNQPFSQSFQDFVKLCLNVNPHKRATAQHLLEHKFFKLVKAPSHIVSTLLSQLTPLHERFKILHGITDDAEQKALRPSSSSIEFDFSCVTPERPEKPVQVEVSEKKGRFTVARSLQAPATSPLPNTAPVNPVSPPTAPAPEKPQKLQELSFEVSTIRSKFAEMELENESMRDKLDQMRAMVTSLAQGR